MYVYIGCPVSSCIKHKQYYKPVITASELLIAFNEDQDKPWFDTATVYLSELLQVKQKEEEEKTELALETVQNALIPVGWISKKHKEEEEEPVSYDIEEGMAGIAGKYTFENVYD